MLDLDRVTPKLQSAYRYWDLKRAGRPMPARADIDPAEMVAFLSHIVLLDVLRDPLDFRYRLMGTAVDAHMTRYYTGLRMSEVPHQRAPSIIWSNFETVLRERTPMLTNVPYVGPHKDFLRVQDLIMPLSSDGQEVDILFAVVDFLRRD